MDGSRWQDGHRGTALLAMLRWVMDPNQAGSGHTTNGTTYEGFLIWKDPEVGFWDTYLKKDISLQKWKSDGNLKDLQSVVRWCWKICGCWRMDIYGPMGRFLRPIPERSQQDEVRWKFSTFFRYHPPNHPEVDAGPGTVSGIHELDMDHSNGSLWDRQPYEWIEAPERRNASKRRKWWGAGGWNFARLEDKNHRVEIWAVLKRLFWYKHSCPTLVAVFLQMLTTC